MAFQEGMSPNEVDEQATALGEVFERAGFGKGNGKGSGDETPQKAAELNATQAEIKRLSKEK